MKKFFRNKNRLIIIFLLLLAFIVLGILYLFGRTAPATNNTGNNPTETPTITETPTPTETTTPTVTQTPKPTSNPTNPPATGTPTPANITTLTCGDCKLAPVDKFTALPSSYAPATVATGLSGGGTLTQEAKNAMVAMFTDASSRGVNMTILSSYRSYQTQQSTFEYWVGTEMAKGYSRAQAEARANTYSARPGHSEHQLGTTADLKCVGCASFDNSAGNTAVYNYLRSHAHEFGFVISYPQGKDALTGYIFEPWHVRFIGVSLATELFNKNYLGSNGEYLAKFLREKGQY